MKTWVKKVLILALIMTVFTGLSAESLMAKPKAEKVATVKPTKKKKEKLRFKKNLVKDLGRSFGEVNAENGSKLVGEFLYHGEFEAWMEKWNLSYIFRDYDESADYELTDDDPMTKIEGRIDKMVNGFEKKASVPSFVKSMKKGLFNVKAEILDGQPTSYYVSERYAEISFKLKKKDKASYRLQIPLNEKDEILPGSLSWLTKK